MSDVGREHAVPRHIGELCIQGVRATGQRLQNADLRQTIEVLQGLGEERDQLQFLGHWGNAVKQYVTIGKIRLASARRTRDM